MSQHDANWAGNPFNRKQQLAQSSLPALLFRQCSLNCVESQSMQATSEAEKTCMINCQEKTYQSFDLMMAVKMRLDSLKRTDHVIDLSKYTGMEVEHGHDTASRMPLKHGVHTEFLGTEEASASARKHVGDTRVRAMAHTLTSFAEKHQQK